MSSCFTGWPNAFATPLAAASVADLSTSDLNFSPGALRAVFVAEVMAELRSPFLTAFDMASDRTGPLSWLFKLWEMEDCTVLSRWAASTFVTIVAGGRGWAGIGEGPAPTPPLAMRAAGLDDRRGPAAEPAPFPVEEAAMLPVPALLYGLGLGADFEVPPRAIATGGEHAAAVVRVD